MSHGTFNPRVAGIFISIHFLNQLVLGMNPAVSVILPAFRCKRYLSGAIQSILDQTMSNLELIVVVRESDGDLLANVVRERFDDPRIKLIIQNGKGYAAAYNLGFSAAKGEFIAIQDCDDISETDRLEVELDILRQDPELEMVYSRTLHLDDNDAPMGISGGLRPGKLLPDETFYVLLEDRNFIQNPSAMFRRRHLLGNQLFMEDLPTSSDYEHNLRIAHDYPIYEVERPLVRLRRGANLGNLSSDVEKNLWSQIQIASIAYMKFHKKCPRVSRLNLLRAYSNIYAQLSALNFQKGRILKSVYLFFLAFVCNPFNKRYLEVGNILRRPARQVND